VLVRNPERVGGPTRQIAYDEPVAFRKADREPCVGSVEYGPFSVRLGLWITIMGAFTLGVLMSPVALEWERFSGSPEGVCTVAHRVLPWSDRNVSRPVLRGARAERKSGSEDERLGRVLLRVDVGPDLRSMDVAFEVATDAAGQIETAIREGRGFEVTLHTWWPIFAMWLAALGGLVSGIVLALRERARFRLDLVRGGAALRVGRRALGVAYELTLDGVTDVSVETGAAARGWHDFERVEDPMAAARLVLVDRAGMRRPLTPRFLLGHAVHLRTAVALRALLNLAPTPGGVEEQLAALAPTPIPTGARILLLLFALSAGFSVGFLIFALPCIQAGGMDALPPIFQWVVGLGVTGCASAGLLLAVGQTGLRLR
jgi:hypothetical protein